MMYLIKKDGKYMLNASDIETIKKYGGEKAKVVFSWDENNQEEALKEYFSRVKVDLSTLELYVISKVEEKYMRACVEGYYKENENVISLLSDVEAINSKEKEELTTINEKAKEKQLDLVTECYAHDPFKQPKKK